MAYRKYLLIIVLLYAFKVSAQENTYQQADSVSYALSETSNWQQLLAFGNQAIASGNDFPALRLRMGYAFFITQNYVAALAQYNQVLANDTYNQTAHYYAYWCNRYLNRYQEANYHASFIDKKTLKDDQMAAGLINAGLETSIKLSEYKAQGTALYWRAFLSNRFGFRFQETQSVAYYNQTNNNSFPSNPTINNNVFDYDQFDYYEKLNYSITSKLIALSAYHFVHTNRANHVALLGLKFTNQTTEWQADVNYAYINQLNVLQYNAKLNWYPLGNLNFYTITRGVFQHCNQNNKLIFDQLVGGKVLDDVWLEGSATFGKQDNYLEADALYVYNFVNVIQFKTQATAYFQINSHLLLPLTYMFAVKNNDYQNRSYNQHSITAAFIWRF